MTRGNRIWLRCLLGAAAGLAALGAVVFLGRAGSPPPPPPVVASPLTEYRDPGELRRAGKAVLWLDALPASLQGRALPSGKDDHNIHPADYVGPQACQKCHPQNYGQWSHHPHRWMNALADDSTVRGDFAGAEMSYLGGRATFTREAGRYLMRLERGGVRRTYTVTQTIGSRFYQYYVGRQVEGPEPRPGAPGSRIGSRWEHDVGRQAVEPGPEGRPASGQEVVLPFGYWLDRRLWVPIVHVGPETPDADRLDPFDPPDQGPYHAVYATSCNFCHTTFAMGDMLARRPDLIGQNAPAPLHVSMRPYLAQTHPDVLPALASKRNPMYEWAAAEHAVTLGVSCEACHLGGREHVQSGGTVPPKFFPSSPHLSAEAGPKGLQTGRTHDNVNWACGRCHIGERPQFAAGMATWNSVEYSDAMRGSCYSKLRCVDCHNPHRATGPRWSASADKDDAVCLKCHAKFEPAPQRLAHTHHPAGSEGARCMNCHMPRLNEGIQDVVRTHMIYSPTRADMLEANHPTACNLCHTDTPIDWTLGRLKEWYGKTCDEAKIARNYPARGGPVAEGWLRSDNQAVRLVAADAMVRSNDPKALPLLLEALDDPFLINRQFATHALEEKLHLRLADLGYRFYMMGAERRQALEGLRQRLSAGPPATSAPPRAPVSGPRN